MTEKIEITPELVVQLYRKHNLKPAAYEIDAVSNCGRCCGLGAVAAELGIEGAGVDKTEALRALYGRDFVGAFTAGFDARFTMDEEKVKELSYRYGSHADTLMLGWRCAQASALAFPQ